MRLRGQLGLPTPKELGLLDLIRVMPAEGSAQ